MRFIPFIAAVALSGSALAQQPLGLEQALSLAEARSAQLAAQRAAAEAAGALVPAAGENPDPKLVVGIENVPAEGGDRWSLSADFMTMKRVGVMQDFVRGEKRELRETRAAAEARREAAVLDMQRADLRREVATAWLERHYAERSQALLQALAREAELQMQVATAEVGAGKATLAEGIAARALRATLLDRRQEAEQRARRAAAMLMRWLGDDASRPLGAAPNVRELHVHHTGQLEANLEEHPHLAMFAPMEAAAEADMRLAAAAKKPDWSLELSYAQRGSAYSDMVSLMFRMELPIFASRRQDPVTASKLKLLEQVRAQAEDAKRRHIAEIRASLSDWEIALARLERHEKELVPLAEERAKAALSGYEGARADLATTLEARRGVIEARLAALNAELELARAWAQLAYLLPERRSP
jgi:outer membrane protein TolC